MVQCGVGVAEGCAVNTDFGCLLRSVMIFFKGHKNRGQVELSETAGT